MGSTVEDPFALVGTTLDRRFAIERTVARGGFGVVYKGLQVTLKKPVAIKVLVMPRGLGLKEKKVFLESFEQEAQTIAALEHPAIVRAYDFGIARPPGRSELPWLALEWIDGVSLDGYLQDRGGQPMTPVEALAILRPVFQGLAFAHGRRIAHRDIKPANIMLVTGSDGVSAGAVSTRILDFGIAKVMSAEEAVGSGNTRTLAVFSAFSAPYAAPEQKIAMKTGPWTDVHALGLILTEMLTGKVPYPGDDPLAVDARVMADVRPTPALFGVDAGPWEAVIARAVALRAPDRFQDAGSFLAALEASVPGAPSVSTPPPAVSVPPPAVSTPPPAVSEPTPVISEPAPAVVTVPRGSTRIESNTVWGQATPPPQLFQALPAPVAAPTSVWPAPPTQSLAPAAPSTPAPPPSRSRGMLAALAVMGVLLVVTIGALVLVVGQQESTPPPGPTPPVRTVPVVQTPPAVPPPPTVPPAPTAPTATTDTLPPGVWESMVPTLEANEANADQLDQQANEMQRTHNPSADGTRTLANGIRSGNDALADTYDNIATTYATSNPRVAAVNRAIARRVREFLRVRRARTDASVHP